ncbi:MAG TPA: hypothetical protein PKD83_11590, partial [Ignavibacteria bacterium]|nr:hypothetical protein [Ignavibacteria bacterium]
MKEFFITSILLFSVSLCFSQIKIITLKMGKTYDQKLLKGEIHKYRIKLREGEVCNMVVTQMGVDVVVDLSGPDLKKILSVDTPNGNEGPENIEFFADEDGYYNIDIYPLSEFPGMTAFEKELAIEKNQGNYKIDSISIFSKEVYQKRHAKMRSFINGLNLGFENISADNLPLNWNLIKDGQDFSLDSKIKYSGNFSLSMESKVQTLAGGFYDSIPVVFEGVEIEIRAFIKTQNVSDGFAGMFIKFFDNEYSAIENQNDIVKIYEDKDWTQYSVFANLPADARNMNIEFILTGTGKMWVDDIQLFVDGKELSHVEYKPREYIADKDHEFDKSSQIPGFVLNETIVDNLAELGKVWGFLKYYHPAIAQGNYNWDYELFRIMPSITACKDKQECNNVLSDWVSGLKDVKVEAAATESGGEIKLRPDLSWINDSALGNKLASQLISIKDTRRSIDNYYITTEPGVGNPNFKNESKYADMKFPDAGFRILALFRYWNIIQYYFSNKHLTGENWNDVLKEYIPEFVNTSDELEYKLALLSLIGRVHDSHASISGEDKTLINYRGVNIAPVKIRFIEDKAVVISYLEPVLGEETGLKIGDIIESVNNIPVSGIVNERLPLTPASNYPTQLRNIAFNLLRTNDSLLTIEYSRDNSRAVTQIKCLSLKEVKGFKNPSEPDSCFRLISPDISYIYPGTIQSKYLPEIMPEILKTKGLIIDLRCYPSDFIVFTLGSYLLPNPTDFVKFSIGSVTSPGLFTMTDNLKVGI